MTLDEMLAREAIRFTLELYNRNADTADYARHAGVFHPDAVMEIQDGPVLNGLPAIQRALQEGAERRGAFNPGNFQRHNLTTSMIDLLDSHSARVTTYVIVTTEIGLDHTGRYDDEFIRMGERWLVKHRKATMEWANPQSRFVTWLGGGRPVEESKP